MAILRGVDGMFYDVPDDKLESFAIPADEVKQRLEDSNFPTSSGPDGGPGGKGGR